MWLALGLALAGATGNNVGKALQKRAAERLPRMELDRATLARYAGSRLWVSGLAVDLLGAVLMVASLDLAPVSLVQPVAGGGLVVLAVFSHYYLEERLSPGEWAGVALSGLGVVAVGLSSEDAGGGATPGIPRLVVGLLGACGALLAAARAFEAAERGPAAKGAAGALGLGLGAGGARGQRFNALGCGGLAGMTFGASSSCVRAGFLLAEAAEGGGGALFGALGVGASMALSTYGIFWQTRGLRDGHSMVVCTAAAAATIVAATIIGLTALGESLPATRGHQVLRLLGCAAILAGTTILGQGGLGEMGDALVARAQRLPAARRLAGRLPVAWGAYLMGKRSALPLHAPEARGDRDGRRVPAGSPVRARASDVEPQRAL